MHYIKVILHAPIEKSNFSFVRALFLLSCMHTCLNR